MNRLVYEVVRVEALNMNEAELINEFCMSHKVQYFDLNSIGVIGYYNLQYQTLDLFDFNELLNYMDELELSYEIDAFEIDTSQEVHYA